jgi:hypothetical protein
MVHSDGVTEILDRLAARGIEVWVDGGWGVDALLGEHGPEPTTTSIW